MKADGPVGYARSDGNYGRRSCVRLFDVPEAVLALLAVLVAVLLIDLI